MDISKEIKKLMVQENFTQEALAEALNTTQANLSKKFKLNNPRINELEEIVNAMGYKIEVNFIKSE